MADHRAHAATTLGFGAQAALLCVGYGLFHACCFSGPLSTVFLARGMALASQVLWTQALFVGATGLGCLAVWALARREVVLMRPIVSYVCYGLLVLGFVLCGATGQIEVVYMLSFLLGMAAAVPVLMWFDTLLTVYRTLGRAQCILVLLACSLLFLAAGALAGVAGSQGGAATALIAAGLVVSAVCQGGYEWLAGRVRVPGRNAEPVVGGHATAKGVARLEPAYGLSVYLVAMECSFGATYGLVRGAVSCSAGSAWPLAWQVLLAVLACVLLAVAVLLEPKKPQSMHFGLMIRLSLAASGVVFAFAPLLCGIAPNALIVLCDVVFAAQSVAMTFLSVEICYERGLPIAEVMPLNFIVFAVCACPSMLLLGLFEGFPSNALAWNLFTALGVTATVALIPALPSSSSTASVFALKELPENESYEARTARTREDMAARYGFSPREHEVFELLVQGMTRGEIAEQLVLSTWTVKQYAASIYNKVGVHSAKELMDLVARL